MVQFANPAALWLLTLLVPLLLLYLLKQRRREVVVPSTLLWRKALEDLRARTPFQRLRSNLLLFLQILILVLAIAVLAKPYLSASPRSAARLILALDTSASMKSKDVKPDRFTEAKSRLLEIIDRAAPGDEIMLIAFSGQAAILHSFSSDHHALRSQLINVQPEDIAGDFSQLLNILEPLAKKTPRPAVVIASDFAEFPPDWPAQLKFEPLTVGKSGENIALTRAAVETVPGDPQTQMLFLQLNNFGRSSQTAEVQIEVNDQTVDAFELALAPGAKTERTLSFAMSRRSRVAIQVRPADALLMDNDFVLYAEPAKKTEVNLLISDRFFKHALSVLPTATVSKNGAIVIQEVTTPPADKSGVFFVNTSRNVQTNRIVTWNESHPVLRFVDAGLWQFSNYTILSVPPGADVLLETTEGPIGYAVADKKTAKIVIGFTLHNSNVFRMAGFPLFLQNSLEWVTSNLQAAEPVLTNSANRREGEIRLEQGRRGYVNFADERESNISPQNPVIRSTAETFSAPARRDLSMWFLLALLAAIILEWWVFHRRVHATV
jgi:Ca-activated chloride channel family protein